MNLIIDHTLSEPPSFICLFRDATLVASAFCGMDVYLQCNKGTRSMYKKWLISNGAYDFIEDIVLPNECPGLLVGPHKKGIRLERLDYGSWDFLKNCLLTFRN